jgi:hypothetical protein
MNKHYIHKNDKKKFIFDLETVKKIEFICSQVDPFIFLKIKNLVETLEEEAIIKLIKIIIKKNCVQKRCYLSHIVLFKLLCLYKKNVFSI